MNLSKPLVSIIVPVYRSEKTISRCINSLLSQTYSKIEIILIENGSPDNSGKICDSFNDDRIQVLHTSNDGVSKARNDGLKVANGDYIAFCDSDDYYDKNYVKENLRVALTYDTDIVVSGYYMEVNEKIYKMKLSTSKFWGKEDLVKNIIIDNHIMGSCWNKFFKRSAIEGCVFPIDMSILEDTYFFLETFENAQKIYYINKCLYYYCDNPNSAVRNVKNLISDNQFLYVKSYGKILHDFHFSLKNQNLIHAALFLFAVEGEFLLKRRKVCFTKTFNNLDKNIKENRSYFFKNKDFPFKEKAKTFLKYIYIKLCVL